jgi:hypothetical protein
VIAERPISTEWFQSPCAVDAVNAAGWPEYELRGIRISVPPAFVLVKRPPADELFFRRGRTSLLLRVRLDASTLFNHYNTPDRRHRHCEGAIGGHLAEAFSFRLGATYGFAARWPDASDGEWLAAVITAPSATDGALLRQALFTLVFPGEKGSRDTPGRTELKSHGLFRDGSGRDR